MDYQFGKCSGPLDDQTDVKAQRIARKHGATFDRRGDSYWFITSKRGAPHDEAVRDAVNADLRTAGLWERLYPGDD